MFSIVSVDVPVCKREPLDLETLYFAGHQIFITYAGQVGLLRSLNQVQGHRD